MKKFIFITLSVIVLLLILIVIFFHKSSAIKTTELKPINTFGGLDVSEKAILGSPSDMLINENNEIVISDFSENKIIIFNADGSVINEIGRLGQGPGELNGPRLIGIEDNNIKVFEVNNNRVQYFSKRGQSLKIISCKFISSTPLTFGINNDVFFPTNGFRTEVLIQHYQETSQELNPIGRIEGSSFQMYDIVKIRNTLIKKDVPDACKNRIILIVAPKGRIYAIFQALPLIKIYYPSGELEKIVQLNLPEFEEIRKKCSLDNLEQKKKGSLSCHFLTFWIDGVVTNNGNLILLMSNPEKMILYKLDKDAKLIQRYIGVDDDIRMIALRGHCLWAYGILTQIFYQFKIER